MKKGRIIIISGPSGSGKTTLNRKLLQSKRLKKKLVKSISVTTRLARLGEKNGRDYLFVSRKLFLFKKRAGHFLEWQKVFDNYYGTPRKAVEQLIKSGKSVLLCIDVKGARTVSRKCPDAIKIFIMPPSLVILNERLAKRGTETPTSLSLRLAIAQREMKEASQYQYVLVNDQLTIASNRLESIILSELN